MFVTPFFFLFPFRSTTKVTLPAFPPPYFSRIFWLSFNSNKFIQGYLFFCVVTKLSFLFFSQTTPTIVKPLSLHFSYTEIMLMALCQQDLPQKSHKSLHAIFPSICPKRVTNVPSVKKGILKSICSPPIL